MAIDLWPARWLAGVFLLGFLSVVCAQTSDRYAGVRITVGIPDNPAVGGPAREHARSWEKRTGGQVEISATPFGKLFETYKDALESDRPRYDVMFYAPAWAGDYHSHLATLPAWVVADESLDDVLPIYRDRLMTWDDRWIAVTVDGDLFTGYYRKDLFEDGSTRAEFRKRFGYELEPPDTWGQYRDIAEFFTGRVAPDGTPLYGTSEPFAQGGQRVWDVFSRVSAYANHPGFRGAQFFDPDTMRAQLNNPAWARAVKDYLDIQAYCPPNAKSFGIIESREAFLSGQTAMSLDWGDTAQNANDPEHSKVHGTVGYFVLPGSTESFNVLTWKWDEMNGPHKAPFLAFGGWVASVPDNSVHQEAAWDFIMWFGSPENSLQDVISAGSGINPYRLTHFTNIDAWNDAFSTGSASEYLQVLRRSLDSSNVALNLRLPGFNRYTSALEIQLSKALNDETPLIEALDNAASAWDEITEDLGLESQRQSYRMSMGLPRQTAGPRPGAGKNKSKLLIGFSQATTTEPWRLLFNKELRNEAARHPEIELLVSDGLDDATKQTNDVREMIARGVDAILLSPKVAQGLTTVVSEAFEAGIPVFVLDRNVANDRYAQFIGGDNREIGRSAGRYAVGLLSASGVAKGKVIEIWGGMASTPARDRHAGFREIIEREPGIEVLNPPQDGDWKQDLGYEIMTEALDRYPSIDLVYAHNDPMAHGAYLAAQDAGRETDMAFLGIDGIPEEGVRWVDEGILTATFLYKTPGEEAIRQALRYLKGEKTPRRVTLPTMTIDRSNASAILERQSLK